MMDAEWIAAPTPTTYCPSCGARPGERCRHPGNGWRGRWYRCYSRVDLSVSRETVHDIPGYPDGATVDVQTDRGSWPARAVVYAPVDGRPVAIVWRDPRGARYGVAMIGGDTVGMPTHRTRADAVAHAVRTAASR